MCVPPNIALRPTQVQPGEVRTPVSIARHDLAIESPRLSGIATTCKLVMRRPARLHRAVSFHRAAAARDAGRQPCGEPVPLLPLSIAAGRRTCLCPASAATASNTSVHTPRCIRRKLARNFRLQLKHPLANLRLAEESVSHSRRRFSGIHLPGKPVVADRRGSLCSSLPNPDGPIPFVLSASCDLQHSFLPRTDPLSPYPHAISSACITQGDSVMKIIISALLALSVLAVIVAPGPYNPSTDDVGLRSPL
jgi:hypothetical protein